MPHYIIVTAGDMAGIGWQILKKLLKEPEKHFKNNLDKQLSTILVVGDTVLSEKKIIHKLFHYCEVNDSEHFVQDILFFLKDKTKYTKPIFLSLGVLDIKKGIPNSHAALRSYLYIKKSIQLSQVLSSASLVTLPVSKEMIMKAGINFVGHTEVLQKSFGVDTCMCMYHTDLAVIPLTHHIPIKKVASKIKKIDYNKFVKGLAFFQSFFKPKKPMAFLGLNPHAGEGGKIGKEEFFLARKLAHMKKNGLNIEGIFSPDSFFTPYVRRKYSLALTCYHDQGLIPFKALYAAGGINITLNLPLLRVSPDHGPAYSLAKSGNADINSVRNSFLFCLKRGKSWIKHYSSLL